MKAIVIGDVHAKSSELSDCWKLLDLIKMTAESRQADTIIFMGDGFNDFGNVNLDVSFYWEMVFDQLKQYNIYYILGNHDFRAGSPARHALRRYKINVVDLMDVHEDGILFIGFTPNNQEFINTCVANKKVPIVFCHAEFDGAQYENGFYSKHGINIEDVPQVAIISGHIHKKQRLGKCFYVGSPRWLTVSDANQEKYIYYMRIEGGKFHEMEAISTAGECSPIIEFKETPDNLFKIPPVCMGFSEVAMPRVTIDLHGPVDFIEKRKEFYKTYNFRIRTFPERSFKSNIRESEGISIAFKKHLDGFTPKYGTSTDVLAKMFSDRFTDF